MASSPDLTKLKDVTQGPTEQRLRHQSAELCHRLGQLTYPLSLRLFSRGTVCQYDLDDIQSQEHPFHQAQRLTSICAKKGEWACQEFYLALREEDPWLAQELEGESKRQEDPSPLMSQPAETALEEPISSLDLPKAFPVAVQESEYPIPQPLQMSDFTFEDNEEIKLQESEKELLQEAIRLLQLEGSPSMTMNMCELGVSLGLRQDAVRQCLYDLEGTGDATQLAALIHCYLEKIGDRQRLRDRLLACDRKRLELSSRGRLLLKLLQEAVHHLSASQEDDLMKAYYIVHFILGDCLAELEERPLHMGSDLKACLEALSKSPLVDRTIAQELEGWREETAEDLLEGSCFVAQLVRDLFPLLNNTEYDGVLVRSSIYHCRLRKVFRVTKFKGLPARTIRKLLAPKHSNKDEGIHLQSVSEQYFDLCLKILSILRCILASLGIKTITDQVKMEPENVGAEITALLQRPEFGTDSFDAAIRVRLLALLKFHPILTNVPTFLSLHCSTFSALIEYLKMNDGHSFQFCLEEVRMLEGAASFLGARSIREPVAVDNGIEEVYRFCMSGPALFLVCLHCRGFWDGEAFKCHQPPSYLILNLPEAAEREAEALGSVIAKRKGEMWFRGDSKGGLEGSGRGLRERLENLTKCHGGLIEEHSCCFWIKSLSTQCDVRIIFKNGAIIAKAEQNTEVR
nr:PREDICTED: uncharacterized protein LOC102346638 isoform X2 [Latimeria chalumnae]|eukprot:XP_014346287.1 PREDICTED: uncharacterized protein LOC102346638 isoform X2 [Latimeria chalumnae]